jgi:BirA family biotin operon repressor/biotin-[acetyl-CoA-carboxylase] ligase
MARLGTPLVELPSCDSTNREALQLGRTGAVEGTVVIARAQTAGRGRRGRSWHSPPGENLYLSVVLRPPCPPSEAPLLTLVAGVALCEAAEQLLAAAPATQAIARLKWPNDLLLGLPLGETPGEPLRKAGGILTELVCAAGRIDFVVVGIGCNVNTLAFPPELSATSLRLARGGASAPEIPIPTVTQVLLERLSAQYERFLAVGPAPALRAFESHAAYIGQAEPVTVRSGEQSLFGRAEGIDPDGALRLRSADGTLHRIVAGELIAGPPHSS